MRTKFTIVFFLILAVSLNVAGIGRSGVAAFVKFGSLAVLYPLEKFSAAAVNGMDHLFFSMVSARSSNEKLRALQDENERLKIQLMSLNALRRENENLKRPFSASYRMPGNFKRIIRSQVIGHPSDLWNSYLTIDCGEKDGVLKGFSVISPEGLIGKIIEAGPSSSKVQLLLDLKSSVSARTRRSQIEALAQGDGGPLIKLNYVPSAAELFIGEEVEVSSSSSLLPGIPIGHISRIGGNEMDLFKTVMVTPSSDFSRLGNVYVVLE